MRWAAIVQMYYPERAGYLPAIVEALQAGTPERVVVWVNRGIGAPVQPVVPGVDWITSSRNTMLGRWAAAVLVDADVVYMQDDDILVHPEMINALVTAAAGEPGTFFGVLGASLVDPPHPYSEGLGVFEGAADMLLGRVMCFHRSAMLTGFSRLFAGGWEPHRADDLLMSFGARCRVLNMPGRWENLDERGVGLSHEAAHYSERDAYAVRLLESAR
jgi:hypothetical protein